MTRVFTGRSVAGRRRFRLLLVSAALAPMIPAAAWAETVISDARTAPVATSTVAGGGPDDLNVANGGSVAPTTVGAAVTLDSNNAVTNLGSITFNNLDDSIGILALGGRTGLIQNAATISLLEDYTPADADGDGDLDGSFTQGARRYGLRITGPEPFYGSVVNAAGGAITVEGADSAAISIETRLQGELILAGGTTVTGDRSIAVRADEVAGSVRVTGGVAATGEGAVGLQLGRVDGAVVLQGAMTSTGYRFTDHYPDDTATKFDSDDLKQNGGAVRLTGSIGGGVLIDRPPPETDSNVVDEDGDGVDDASEQTGFIASYGAAPAIAIGGPSDVVLGRVGGGEDAFGFVNKGTIAGYGVHNGSTATGLRIGGTGARTVIEGGINNRAGVIEAQAYQAEATAIDLAAGALVPELINSGGSISASITTSGSQAATAVLVEQGASLSALRNHGLVSAAVTGAAGDAVAVRDRSGSLSLIENTGVIQAGVAPPTGTTPTGRPVALDLAANTSGVTIRQWGVTDGDDGADGAADPDADADGVDDDQEPRIQGDVLLGVGDDRVELANGEMIGGLSFGAGADLLSIDGGARFSGVLVDADGRLTIDVRKGRLSLVDSGALRMTSLTVGADGALSIGIDPQNNIATRFEASGAVVIDKDAEIALTLKSAVKSPQSFELIRAGALSATGVAGSLVGAPYVYNATLRAEGNSLYADLRPRTAAEVGLNRSGAQAYSAVIGTLGSHAEIEAAVLAKMNREDFLGLYDQLLPDHSGASLTSAAGLSNAITQAVSQPRPEGGASAFWAQEIFVQAEHDRVDAQGYASRGIGFAAGLEQSGRAGAAYGMALGLASVEFKDQGAAIGEEVVMNIAAGSIYVRQEVGGLMADVRAGAGVAVFDSERRIVSVSDGLDLTAKGDWLGWFVEAHAGLAYELALGPLRIRPRGELDYIRLRENAYEEEGAGTGADLSVDSRSGALFTGTASVSMRLEFGESFRWGPEFTVGRRERFSGSPGTTTARWLGGGADFSLSPETPFGSATILRGALKGTALGTSVSLEGGVETAGAYKQWDARAVVKFAF
jgi:hypothetical protein